MTATTPPPAITIAASAAVARPIRDAGDAGPTSGATVWTD
jgi:hypothetical protein